MIKNNIVLLVDFLPVANPSLTLGNADIIRFAKNISITRGKSSVFSNFNAGSLTVEFGNIDGSCEPVILTLPNSNKNNPFDPSANFGYYARIPGQMASFRHEIVFAVLGDPPNIDPPIDLENPAQRGGINWGNNVGDPGGEYTQIAMFGGITDNWEYEYDVDGNAIVTMTAYESYKESANQPVDPFRLNQVAPTGTYLDDQIPGSSAEFPFREKQNVLGIGNTTVPATPASFFEDKQDLQQKIAQAEQGVLFINSTGFWKFIPRLAPSTFAADANLGTYLPRLVYNFGGESDLQVSDLKIDYSSDLVYNRINMTNTLGTNVVVEDTESIEQFGLKELTFDDMLVIDAELTDLATAILEKYSRKKFRVTSFSVNLTKYDQESGLSQIQKDLLQSDIGDYCIVTYDRNPIKTATYVGQIIGIKHDVTPDNYVMTFTLDEKRHQQLILDDEVFGRLDENVLN